MRLCITARRIGLRGAPREDLEQRVRLLLGSWTCRIRQAKVYIEDLNGPKGGLDVRCAIEAALISSGTVTVRALGSDVETAVRGAARRLVRRVKREFYRGRAGRKVGSMCHVGLSCSGDVG